MNDKLHYQSTSLRLWLFTPGHFRQPKSWCPVHVNLSSSSLCNLVGYLIQHSFHPSFSWRKKEGQEMFFRGLLSTIFLDKSAPLTAIPIWIQTLRERGDCWMHFSICESRVLEHLESFVLSVLSSSSSFLVHASQCFLVIIPWPADQWNSGKPLSGM